MVLVKQWGRDGKPDTHIPPQARCDTPKKGGRIVLHGMVTVSFLVIKYYKLTFSNVWY